MTFTDKQYQVQQTQVKELEDELSRLNAQFEAQLETAGLTLADLTVDAETLSFEQHRHWEAIQEAVKRDGAARAAQSQPQQGSRAPGAGRRNIVRL